MGISGKRASYRLNKHNLYVKSTIKHNLYVKNMITYPHTQLMIIYVDFIF